VQLDLGDAFGQRRRGLIGVVDERALAEPDGGDHQRPDEQGDDGDSHDRDPRHKGHYAADGRPGAPVMKPHACHGTAPVIPHAGSPGLLLFLHAANLGAAVRRGALLRPFAVTR
jgi:hypothetical protein